MVTTVSNKQVDSIERKRHYWLVFWHQHKVKRKKKTGIGFCLKLAGTEMRNMLERGRCF